MKARVLAVLVGVDMLTLAGCASRPGPAAQPPPMPPLSAEEDRTIYNNEQVALFVSRDPAWQAWLNAMQRSNQADNAIVDASRYNTPVTAIIERITEAQDAYRIAMSFRLTPFTVTSSCLDLPSETTGVVRLWDGLTLRYEFLLKTEKHFANGSSCEIDTGLVDEVDSSGGLPLAAVAQGQQIDWQRSFSDYLKWGEPFLTISTGTTLSQSDIVRIIEF